jgi:CheY-like chemotaxis protein
LLTPFGQPVDSEVGQTAGLRECVTRPVRQGQLHDCLARVLGLQEPEADVQHMPLSPVLAAAQPPRRILLVEDNQANQLVALGFLKLLGYQAEVAGTGLAALEALTRQSYDLVLMDCQMPELDGYATTTRLRALEGPARHTPVIAMTAHALPGDRERCLAAGMDDYLSKPLRLEALREVLWRWGPAPPGTALPAAASPLDQGVVAELQALMGETFGQAVHAFLQDAQKYLEAIRLAVVRGDTQTLSRMAHTLKGSSSNLGATRLASLCADLLENCHPEALDQVPAQVERIVAELAQVQEALARLGQAETVYRRP